LDKRTNNGGHSTKSTKDTDLRKRDKQLALIEKLSPLEESAFNALKKGIEKADFKYVQMYYQYMYGKPKESKDITTNGENINNPIIVFGEDNDKS